MTVTRSVSVERNRLRFAAAHMATFHDECEPLHGHNYDVIVEMEGTLTEDSWVWDFGDLKRTTKAIIDELDHKFLLQAESRVLQSQRAGDVWHLWFGDRRYELPATDVAALPIDNTTAERIAEWVAVRMMAALRGTAAGNLRRLKVGIEEMPGQAGWYTVDL